MLKTFLFALFLLVLTFAAPVSAEEGRILDAGDPPPAQLETDSLDYIDIHDRRFAYRDEDIKFKKLVDERRANYIAPGQKALNQYKDNLKARHDAYEPPAAGEPAEFSNDLADELVGPPDPAANLNP